MSDYNTVRSSGTLQTPGSKKVRGELVAGETGAAFYANGEKALVDGVLTCDLPKYVKLRARMNGPVTR